MDNLAMFFKGGTSTIYSSERWTKLHQMCCTKHNTSVPICYTANKKTSSVEK